MPPVWGQFQHERGALGTPHEGVSQQQTDEKDGGDAGEVEREDHRPFLTGEQGTGQQHVHGQVGRAAHEGHEQGGEEPVIRPRNHPGGEQGGHIAAEPDDEG